jgi:lipoate-protein ligase A
VLADLDVPFMLEVLDIPAAKLGDRAVEAVQERITTVSRELGASWRGESLRQAIAFGFGEALGVDVVHDRPDTTELELSDRIVADKYATEDWLFSRTPQPDATATSVLRTPAGLVRVYVALQGDTIKSALFTGDFNDIPRPIVEFESALKWARLARHDVEQIASTAFVNGTGLEVASESVVACVLEAGERARGRTLVSAPARDGSCYFPDDEEAQ